MIFFTKVDIPSSDWQIDYTSRIAFFGSCFADNISAQFASRKFKVLANPFGTVYNPFSIAKQIKLIANGKVFGNDDVFQDMRFEKRSTNWFSWNAHGSLSGKSCEECVAKLNAATAQAKEFLQQADVVFITFGTAFVYFLKSLNENGTCEKAANENARGTIVANCHRQDSKFFERKMITVEEAASAIREIVEEICKIKNNWIASPSARNNVGAEKRDQHIIFTVSPLRHLSDGAHGNNLSKATLQLAIDKAINEIAEANSTPTISVEYFPSYEIVMDELRDYRFYDNDMIHLSKVAEEYIFERMVETYCTEKTRRDIKQVEKFLKSANHCIQDADAPATKAFLQKLHADARKLESQIAGLELNV